MKSNRLWFHSVKCCWLGSLVLLAFEAWDSVIKYQPREIQQTPEVLTLCEVSGPPDVLALEPRRQRS